MPLKLTEEKRALIHTGHKLEELKQSEAFKAYVTVIEQLRDSWRTQALAKGDSDFEKGTLNGLSLGLSIIDDTIEAMQEVVAEVQAYETVHPNSIQSPVEDEDEDNQ